MTEIIHSTQDFLQDFAINCVGFFHFVLGWDKMMFKHINQDWSNSFFDVVMPFITDYHNTWYFIVVLLYIIIRKAGKKFVPILLGCVLSLALADSFAARVIKPIVNRSRPALTEPNVKLRVPPQGSPSFPSNHAANCFAVATFMGLYIVGTGPIALFCAALIGYSRIYVGVHYPLDVIGGAIVGFLAGLLIYKIFLLIAEFTQPKERVLTKKWRKKNYLHRSSGR